MKTKTKLKPKKTGFFANQSRIYLAVFFVASILAWGGIYVALTEPDYISTPIYGSPQNQGQTKAATKTTKSQPAIVYLRSANKTYSRGAFFTVEVRENSNGVAVNAIQANFTYPADKLTLVNIDNNSSAFPILAQNDGAKGQVSIARGVIGKLKGDQLVAKLTFRASAKTNSASLKFSKGTLLVTATDNKNILSSLTSNTIGASFVIR